MRKALIICFAVLVFANACGVENLEPNRTLPYKIIGDHKLQLHLFNPTKHSASDRRPAIIFFFGGGWRVGSPSQFYPHWRYLASRGMVAISAEYRIKSKHGTSPFECVKDGKSAIRWVRAHSAELGIDPDRVAADGASAGGHVAAATGTVKGFEEPHEDAKVRSKPNALVLFYPVFDNGPGGYGHDLVKDHWKEFSPMHNIDKNTPPTTILLGTEDKYIPVSTAKKYKSLMEKYGVRCDLNLYKGQPHGFCNHPSFKGISAKYFKKVYIEMDKFLKSLGYLEGTPTLKSQ